MSYDISKAPRGGPTPDHRIDMRESDIRFMLWKLREINKAVKAGEIEDASHSLTWLIDFLGCIEPGMEKLS